MGLQAARSDGWSRRCLAWSRVALSRTKTRPTVTPWLLLLAPAVPLILLVLDLLFNLPLALGRLVVSTNAVLAPFGLGWLALGVTVWSHN